MKLENLLLILWIFIKKKSRDEKPVLAISASLSDVVHNKHVRHVFWMQGWFQSHHFIDYDDEKMLTLMILKFGEFLGKGFKLEKRELPTE